MPQITQGPLYDERPPKGALSPGFCSGLVEPEPGEARRHATPETPMAAMCLASRKAV